MDDLPLLVVFGATGATGSHVVKKAIDGGQMRVRVFVRSPGKVPAELSESPRLEVFKGTFTDLDKVSAALEGAKYVISTAGNTQMSKDGIMEKMASAIADAMPKHGVERFVYQAGAFSPAEGDPPVGLMMKIMAPVLKMALGLGAMIADNNAVISVLKEKKDIKWVVSRPGMIKEAPSKGMLKKSDKMSQACTFSDLAQFNLDAVVTDEFDGTAPFVCY